MSGSVDIVVPTVAGREESLARCIESYERHTEGANLIVVRDEPTCGLAWREGLTRSRAPYVHLTCDDIELRGPGWFEACGAVVDRGYLPCPVVYRPDGSLESCGGDREAPARLTSRLQPDGTEVDFTVLPFMGREQAEAIGMIEAHYMADVWVSARGRQLGWRTVIVRAFEVTHHYENVGRRSSRALRLRDRRIFAEAIG